MVCVAAFVSQDVSAGTCNSFCQTSITNGLQTGQNPYTMVLAVPGGSCVTSASCTQSACNIPGYSAATPAQAQRFCELVQEAPYRSLAVGAAWCADYLARRWEGAFCRLDGNEGNLQPQQRQNVCSFTCEFEGPIPAQTVPDGGACSNTTACQATCNTQCAARRVGSVTGRCAITPPAACQERGYGAPVVTAGPAPVRATPDQAFRCVYACAGEDAPRNGNTCSGATDVSTCTAQCNTTCARTATGASGCLGVVGGAQPENTGAAPRCVATAAVGGATPSVGGLVDSQRFETVNETFTDINIPSFIARVVRILIGFAGALFFAMLVWGGVRWMTAGGDADAVKKAQTTTMNAIIGVIIIALAYTVVTAFMQIIVQLATPS